jgi:hypothetical protein
MLILPDEYNTLFTHFHPFFSERVWPLALLLLVGAILAPGKRTVAAARRPAQGERDLSRSGTVE